MKILIFGGTGFIGSRLADHLEEAGHEVQTVGRSGRNADLALDITNSSEFSRIKFSPEVVVNAASRLPGESSSDPEFVDDLFKTNVVGAVNIANWAVNRHVKLIINCSSLSVVGKPWPVPLSEEDIRLPQGVHVAYAMSKLSQEQLMKESVRESETQLLHLRLSAVYGNKMSPGGILFNLLDKMKENAPVELVDAEKNSVDFIHVEDVCRSISKLAEESVKDDVINLASGRSVSINELAFLLKKITGSESEIRNSNTERPASKAVVEVERLKKYLEKTYREFIPLERGLEDLVRERNRASRAQEKSIL